MASRTRSSSSCIRFIHVEPSGASVATLSSTFGFGFLASVSPPIAEVAMTAITTIRSNLIGQFPSLEDLFASFEERVRLNAGDLVEERAERVFAQDADDEHLAGVGTGLVGPFDVLGEVIN